MAIAFHFENWDSPITSRPVSRNKRCLLEGEYRKTAEKQRKMQRNSMVDRRPGRTGVKFMTSTIR
jgi:hypothetical protein